MTEAGDVLQEPSAHLVGVAFPKPRPAALERADRKRARDKLDRAESAKVKARSGGRCEVVERGAVRVSDTAILASDMVEVGDRLSSGGYRGWVHPFRERRDLAGRFDHTLLSIGQQLTTLQTSQGCTLDQLAQGSQLSDRGISNIAKAQSDPKLSTLIRIGAFFGCDVVITFRPAGTTVR